MLRDDAVSVEGPRPPILCPPATTALRPFPSGHCVLLSGPLNPIVCVAHAWTSLCGLRWRLAMRLTSPLYSRHNGLPLSVAFLHPEIDWGYCSLCSRGVWLEKGKDGFFTSFFISKGFWPQCDLRTVFVSGVLIDALPSRYLYRR